MLGVAGNPSATPGKTNLNERGANPSMEQRVAVHFLAVLAFDQCSLLMRLQLT